MSTETDFERWKTLYDDMGIGSEILEQDDDTVILRTMEGQTKVDGYVGFCTDVTFTKEGSFIDMGAWE